MSKKHYKSTSVKVSHKMFGEIESPGVDFTNVLLADFTPTDPKSAKKQSSNKCAEKATFITLVNSVQVSILPTFH